MGFRLGAHMGARLGGWLVIGVAGTAIAADGLPPLRVDPALIGAPNPVKPAKPASVAVEQPAVKPAAAPAEAVPADQATYIVADAITGQTDVETIATGKVVLRKADGIVNADRLVYRQAEDATEATGGFADLLPAHQIMAIPVPDEVPDEAPQARPRGRDDDARQCGCRERARCEHGAVDDGQERARQTAQPGKLACGDGVVARADDAVDEAQGELEAVRVGDEPRETARGAPLTRRLGGRPLLRGVHPGAGESLSVRDQVVEGPHPLIMPLGGRRRSLICAGVRPRGACV